MIFYVLKRLERQLGTRVNLTFVLALEIRYNPYEWALVDGKTGNDYLAPLRSLSKRKAGYSSLWCSGKPVSNP